jgi:hypothetical protein
MHRGRTLIRRLYYGYDPASLYLRLELNEPLERHSGGTGQAYQVAFYLAAPRQRKVNRRVRFSDTNPDFGLSGVGLCWEILVSPTKKEARLSQGEGQEVWRPVSTLTSVAMGEMSFELAVPLEALGLRLGDAVEVVATLALDGVLVDALPTSDTLGFSLEPRV